ncbi:MAG TPA: HD domain-containing protein [Erysipelothrix sp.]|nr:HD domain-containing protein [Erysipelothrix sp.]
MSTHFKKTEEHKVLRDPVHGYINVYYDVIWQLIDAPEFQRLRRIHQLGGTLQVYHTAEHSRFGHSLGVYEITRLMLENVQDLKESISEYDQVSLLCAALLHDVGHGPFSHAFEAVTDVNHEIMTDRIILEDTNVHQILKEVHKDFPQDVADIIAHRHKNTLLSQIISSQMDADRMDYLLRDSYFTGVSYGEFDLYRILRTLRVVDNTIAVKESGIHAIEDYIMARYQMYWQVYLHPVSRSYEAILLAIFKRMDDLMDENPKALDNAPVFIPFLSDEKIDINDYLYLDEPTCIAGFKALMSSEDAILSDLTRRLLNRDLFDYHDATDKKAVSNIEDKLDKHNFDKRYYLQSDHLIQTLYKPYKANEDASVWIVQHGELQELSQSSIVVRGFVRNEEKEDSKIFFPKEIEE